MLLNQFGLPVHMCVAGAKEKSGSAQDRLDILLTNHKKYVIEVCANVSAGDVNEHIVRSARYLLGVFVFLLCLSVVHIFLLN